MESKKEKLFAGEEGFSSVKDEHRLNITLATNAEGWNTTVNGQLVIELAKDPRVKVSGLVPNSSQEQKEQAKQLNIKLVDAKKRIGFSPEERLSFPPDSLDIDILIIHSYGRDLGKQAQVVKESKKCKWLHVLHTVSEELEKYMDKERAGPSSSVTDSEHQLQLELCKEADILIAVGPKVADAFKWALCHCGKHMDIITLTPSVIQELIDVRPHHESGEVFRILISGTYPAKYFKVKGCDIAAKAVSLLQDTSYSLMFIVTPRDDAQDLQNRLVKEGIKLNQFTVRRFHSSTENWRKLLCEVNLVIMPSRTEGFGTSSLRAISADLPVLVSGNSGLGMTLKKLPAGKNHVVESDDPQEWADRIAQVRAMDARNQSAEAKQLRSEYMERFSWKDQCSNLVDKMMMMFPNKQEGIKKCVEHTEESEQGKNLEPKITSFETERVVYEENFNFITRGTKKLGLADMNLSKAGKSEFDQVDSPRVPLAYVADKRSSADQLKSNRLSTKVIDIPYAILGKVCLKLNAKDSMFYKDYRLLGEMMGYSKDVTRDLERKDNPTDALLQLWSIKPEATVQNLIALLRDSDLERVDVATILEDWVERKGSK
ncbi:uncharacterized protein LOC110044458 [Orbicella faveolata]|uniref:uncharacterized protein LOC110044458 n=1 Tax=Orbicella faveolata TaxID=48498 RepID=UPI0009E5C7E1|nr:uncharacterized protein LOC110044458 [Orbicella faveolata]